MSVSPPKASRIAILGTSLVQQNNFGKETSLATSACGWMSWAEVQSHGRLSCPAHHDPSAPVGWEPSNRPGVSRFFSSLNFGVSGQNAIEIIRRLPRLLQSDFDLIVIDAGKTVIPLPILARGIEKWPAGGAQWAKAHWINRQSIEFADRHANRHLFDWNSAWVDPKSELGEPYAGYFNDGRHFSVMAGFAVGKALANYLETIVPRAPTRISTRDDRFDPVNNPQGNLASDLGAETTTEKEQQSHSLGGKLVHPATGAWPEAICDIDVPAHDDLLGISLRLKDVAAEGKEAVALAPFRAEDGSVFVFPQTQLKGALRTPPLKLRPGGRDPKLYLDVILRPGSKPLGIDVSRIDIRTVSSPVRA